MKAGLIILLLLTACNEKPVEKKTPPPTLITVTQASAARLESTEQTLGTLEAVNDPKISAEVAGHISKIAVRAGEAVKKGQLLVQLDPSDTNSQARSDASEISRLEALFNQQERVVSRQDELVQKNFISRNALDDATAQRDALKSQLTSAQARAGLSRNNVVKTRIISPFDGVVEEQIAAVGDYIKLGDPILRIVSNAKLRVHLPFPESTAPRLKVGQEVRIFSPLIPNTTISGVIEDIRPSVTETSRAIDAIARINPQPGLRSGGSVEAAVITGSKENAIQVPEQSVVLRPAGKVIYVIKDNKAEQRLITIGSKQAGRVEILQGVQAGETVALDGAGFLSNGASVAIREIPGKAVKPADKPAATK